MPHYWTVLELKSFNGLIAVTPAKSVPLTMGTQKSATCLFLIQAHQE